MLVWLGLQSLSGLIAQEKQQIDTTSLLSVENNRDSFWQRTPDGRSIFFNKGYVGIGTWAPFFMLDVEGDVGTTKLTIKQAYSLPTTATTKDHFLNGLGEWAVPAGGGGGGDCYWEGGLGKGIFFNKGNVGIGTPYNNANARLQVVGNMNVGNNPHTGSLIGENAFVGGLNSIASGNTSFSFGRESKATHMYAVAIGFKAEATSEMAVAIGYINKATAESTYLFGERLSAGSSGAFVIGRGASSVNSLQNNVNNSLMMGFNSNVPTFFIGPSSGAGTTGRIGIGNMTDPQDKLHIKADATETATIRLEPTATTGNFRFAHIYMGMHSISAANNANMVFTTPAANRHFVFENGNVGIGVASPTSPLHVVGNAHVTGGLIINNTVAITNDRIGRFANGTASAPAFSFSTNTNTGMFLPESNTLAFSTLGVTRILINNTGYVGIGTSSPNTPLHVHKAVTGSYGYVHRIEVTGTATFVNNTKALEIKANTTNDAFLVYGDGRIETKGGHLLFNRRGNSSIRANDDLSFRTNSVERIRITKDGNVGIGTANTQGYMLAVKGKIIAEEVKIIASVPSSDYVFEPDYPLMPLGELEQFVANKKHLPEVPSAVEFSENGYSIGEMDDLLLRKIEELTLYIIQQQKEIDALKSLINK
jgi:hypothetical protein